MKSFTAGGEWTRVSIPLSDFGTDGHDLKAIMFAALAVPGRFSFRIDDVRLEPAASAPVAFASSFVAAQALSDKRAFGVLPNYKTVERGMPSRPLTEHEKFILATKDTFDPPILFVSVALAGWSQSKNQDPSFGQGMSGYAKRFGTGLADQVTGNYLVEWAMPALLHQDPRYFRQGTGPVVKRAAYAATRVFVTRTDSGRSTMNLSDIAGNGMAAATGNFYYKDSRRLSDNLGRMATFTMTEAFGDVMKEFWPDIKRIFKHRNSEF